MGQKRSQKGRVFVVGSSNTDLVIDVPAIPRPGETVLGGALAVFAGGKGANQAVAAARSGALTYFVGGFGDDEYGLARRAELELEGVRCAGCVRYPKTSSGVALIAVSRRGENAIVVAPGANALLTASAVRRGLSEAAAGDVVLLSLEIPRLAVAAAARTAKRKGARVILNPAPFPAGGLPRELFAFCDFVTPNEHEFEALLGSASSRDKLARLRRFAPDVCFVVTRGPGGVDRFAAGGYERGVVRPPRVRAVDTVGAGDCFNGALAARLALGEEDLDAALRFAVTASAISVTRPGAQSSMPFLREIRKRLGPG